MLVLVIGGTGHIGSYLIPRLVRRGHKTICLSRRRRQPYVADDAWAQVEHAVIDRSEEEPRGRFGERIAALRADVVIDLTCYTLDSAARAAADAATGAGHHRHFSLQPRCWRRSRSAAPGSHAKWAGWSRSSRRTKRIMSPGSRSTSTAAGRASRWIVPKASWTAWKCGERLPEDA